MIRSKKLELLNKNKNTEMIKSTIRSKMLNSGHNNTTINKWFLSNAGFMWII